MPVTGNYVYLQSDNGDYIGQGRTYLYTDKTALLGISASGTTISLSVVGDQRWNGTVVLPSAAATLQTGHFKELTRAASAAAATGGLDWYGEARGCGALLGSVIIDQVKVENNKLVALDLRFEQHCEGRASALRGQVHWSQAEANAVVPDGPQPIPADLWRPVQGAVPSSGSYVYLSSTAGDYIGGGRDYVYTPSDANLKVTGTGAHALVTVDGNDNWIGNFKGMQSLSQLQVGYYPGLLRYHLYNPLTGALSWSGEGRACNTLTGWFAIDAVSYSGGVLTSLDLRFEQHCEGGASSVRGQIHWRAGEPAAAAGPVNPPPANLWTPPASFVPPAGNYIFLVSDPDDWVGAGLTQLYTSADSTITVDASRTAALAISVGNSSGTFVGMQSLSQLTPGYYGDLQRYPFHNAVKGGMDWSGNMRGCNTLSGWFVVDQVSYALGALTSIDLRFEQRCNGGPAALRGVIHWKK